MEISALPAESIRRDYALRFELIVTHGTTKLYRAQRRHSSSYLNQYLFAEMDKE